MVTEIEIKAHVRDSEALRELLSRKAELRGAFEKRDVYWFGPEASAFPVTKIRIRREKRSFAGGAEKSLCLVTYKAKEENNGIETNEELEFEVNPAEEFEEFLKKAGLRPGAGKTKRGWVFEKAVGSGIKLAAAKLCAELVEVDSLGWFIETEILVDAEDKSEETRAEAKKALLAFLDSLGIEREAIEGRFYLDMLSSADQRTDN